MNDDPVYIIAQWDDETLVGWKLVPPHELSSLTLDDLEQVRSVPASVWNAYAASAGALAHHVAAFLGAPRVRRQTTHVTDPAPETT